MESLPTLEDLIDSLREKGKWEDVKKQHKVYVKNMKQHKAFKSKYAKEEERLAYAEVMKADLSINKRGRDHSAWKHIQFALDACPDCPTACALATLFQLDRDHFPKNVNLLREMTDNFTSNVKKNLNKIKAQAQAMMSTEESVENEEEEENSEEEEELEEYPVQKEGWRVVFRVTE
ncbi:hypothetical protein WA577_004637, partial [Blastocystis sp. JDR]